MADLIITVTPALRIRVGGGAATIEEESVTKTGKNAGQPRWTPTGYYGTLDDALAGLHLKHLDKLSTQQIIDIGRAREEIADGVRLLRQVSAGRLLSEKRAAEAHLLELGERVTELESALAKMDEASLEEEADGSF